MDKAKVFWSGQSQAIRLPKKYRFETGEVLIRRQGRTVILEPQALDWAWLDDLIGPVDEDFVEAALERPVATTR
jgi:antitoxin VapB